MSQPTLSQGGVGSQAPEGTRNMEILNQARGLLNASPYPELRAVQCRLDGGILILTGTVRTFYMKQMAYEALRVNGCQVINNVQVEDLS